MLHIEGGRYPGVRNVIQDGGPGDAAVQLGVVGHVSSYGEDGMGYAHSVPIPDHGEAGAEKSRRDVGDTGGG